jgi:uncharacterized protein Yka (UPF0111/DUF47 family)
MWVDRAVKWLLPREEHFFDLLERAADCARESGAMLVELLDQPNTLERRAVVDRLQNSTKRAGQVITEVFDGLNRTFVTPLDRSDIYDLTNALERCADVICSAGLQLVVHDIEDLPQGTRELAALIDEACKILPTAVDKLRGRRQLHEIGRQSKRLKELEMEGDDLLRHHLGEMFRSEKDAIRLIKHKELLEGLEQILDDCERVGRVLETIVIKNS